MVFLMMAMMSGSILVTAIVDDDEPDLSELKSKINAALKNPVASENVAKAFSQIRRMFRNDNASEVIRNVASGLRTVLTDQIGTENVLHLVQFVRFYLTDPNASETLKAVCQQIKVTVSGANNVVFKENFMTMLADLTEAKKCNPFYQSLVIALKQFVDENPSANKVTANFKRLNWGLKLTIKANRKKFEVVETRSLNENPLLYDDYPTSQLGDDQRTKSFDGISLVGNAK